MFSSISVVMVIVSLHSNRNPKTGMDDPFMGHLFLVIWPVMSLELIADHCKEKLSDQSRQQHYSIGLHLEGNVILYIMFS